MKRNGIIYALGFALLTFGTFVQVSETKRILALEFFGSKSHVITYLALLEQLQRNGHEITLVGPGAGLTKEKGIREIFTAGPEVFAAGGTAEDFYMLKEQNVAVDPFKLLVESLPKHCLNMYERPDMKSLMNESFDLILTQPLFNECSMGYIHRIRSNSKDKTPLILFIPTTAPNFVVGWVGGYHSPSFVSNMFLGFSDEMSFVERMTNFATNVMSDLVYSRYYIPLMEKLYREKLGEGTPSVAEILGDASLVLTNEHFSIAKPKPYFPDVVNVGGIHSRDALPLPRDLEDFIKAGGDAGFIYFSFGTGLRADQMSKEKRAIFLNVFSKLKQQVIWKYESEFPEQLPPNVHLAKWLPQQDILGHPKIRMFITHCGGGGNEESIYHGVPLLGIPFFGDQPLNARQAVAAGYMVKLEWNELSEEILMDGISELLKNPKYRQSVQRISSVFKDQIEKPLDRGVWWIEYVLRHNGATQLRSAARKLNFFQYHCLDLIATYLGAIFLLLAIIFKAIKLVFGKCFGSSKNEKDLKNGNSKKYK